MVWFGPVYDLLNQWLLIGVTTDDTTHTARNSAILCLWGSEFPVPVLLSVDCKMYYSHMRKAWNTSPS